MGDFDLARLVYLGLLGSVLVVWFVAQNRQSLSSTVKQAGAWVLIFFGVIAVVGLWDDIRHTIQPTQTVFAEQGRIEVPRAPDGHYYLTLMINDEPVKFVVDTGASSVVLTQDAAQRIGLDVDDLAYVGRAMTANGEVRTAPVTLEQVALGPVKHTNVSAWVNDGDMSQSLLGMTYLQKWSRIEIANGSLVLVR